MNDTTIQMIAQAIIANTKVIQSLIEALPHDVKVAVAGAANVAPAAPVAPTPAPVVQAAPVAPAMPAPPVFTVPAAAPAPVAAPVGLSAPATLEKAPFVDAKGLLEFVMSAYKALGPQKGAGIQNVLVTLGYNNINDVNPAHYDALFAGVKALA